MTGSPANRRDGGGYWRDLVYHSRPGMSATEQALASLARAHHRAVLYPHTCGLQWEALQAALVRCTVRSGRNNQWSAPSVGDRTTRGDCT